VIGLDNISLMNFSLDHRECVRAMPEIKKVIRVVVCTQIHTLSGDKLSPHSKTAAIKPNSITKI
jgi:hypothetical protein